jgi:ubiquinone/menaquinone biosynthesis C-methylase UbiE
MALADQPKIANPAAGKLLRYTAITMENDKDKSKIQLPLDIIDFYSLGLESSRFQEIQGEIELIRTKEIVSRYLTGEQKIILDIGGGPGEYACWLAKKGHKVHLIDPIPLHIKEAKQASNQQPTFPLESINLGDARSLSFPNDFADIVLLMGPLYHLTNREERILALKESLRVLKTAGTLITVGISRYASSFSGLANKYLSDPEFIKIIESDLKSGQHRNPTDDPRYFTTSFFHRPSDLKKEVSEAGFKINDLLALEGMALFLNDLEKQWDDPILRERILDIVRELESVPSVIGVTGHLVCIGFKPEVV